jgi:RNA polymerase sigma factor (TIGR02999 family)
LIWSTKTFQKRISVLQVDHFSRALRATIALPLGGKMSEQSANNEATFHELYDELRRLARSQLHRHGYGASIQPTTLLHETYLAMRGRDGSMFESRSRFMAYAARAMRGLIVDHLRNSNAQKRGGEIDFTELSTHIAENIAGGDDIEAVSDAVEHLATIEPQLAELVELKFFCGFTFAEIAEMRGVTERTVQRQWDKARILLYAYMHDEGID